MTHNLLDVKSTASQTSRDLLRSFFTGRLFSLLIIIAAVAVVALDAQVQGVYVFGILIVLLLIVCEDISATLLPFLLLCTFVTVCYNSFDTFIEYKYLAGALIAGLLFRFIVYRKKIILGKSFSGLVAVAIAVTLGGLGTISAKEYFAGVSLYYVFGLGFGMVLIYILLKSQYAPEIENDKKTNVRMRFAGAMYIMGLFAAYIVIFNQFDNFAMHGTMDFTFQAANNLSTILMFALPFPFWFAIKKKMHLISAAVMFLALLLSSSRAGLLMGSAEIFICIIYLCIADKKRRRLNIIFAVCFSLIALALAFLFLRKYVLLIDLVDGQEPRMKFLQKLVAEFKNYVIFGHGLGYTGNTDIYSPVKGALYWYHMMIPQILGSMGLVGAAAYGYQIVLRFKILLKHQNPYKWALGLSYVGILLMSQVNPGEFCPIPYGLMTTLLFVFAEHSTSKLHTDEEKLPEYPDGKNSEPDQAQG